MERAGVKRLCGFCKIFRRAGNLGVIRRSVGYLRSRTALHQVMQSEWHLVRMRSAPCHDSLELQQVVGNRTDFHEFGFDDVRFPHVSLSMAQSAGLKVPCALKTRPTFVHP